MCASTKLAIHKVTNTIITFIILFQRLNFTVIMKKLIWIMLCNPFLKLAKKQSSTVRGLCCPPTPCNIPYCKFRQGSVPGHLVYLRYLNWNHLLVASSGKFRPILIIFINNTYLLYSVRWVVVLRLLNFKIRDS